MNPLLIILTGHAPDSLRTRLGDFDHWFRLGLGVPAADVVSVDVAAGETLPDLSSIRGAVITGSAAMVTDHLPWSEQLAGWIRTAMDAELPLFGVCYGHQLMAHALGGTVGDLPGGREIGTLPITRIADAPDDALLKGLPQHFLAHTTHQQSVLQLPPGATALASSERDPYHIVRYAPHAISTQFHPEFSVSIMRAYLRLRAGHLYAEGLDVPTLVKAAKAAPQARHLLRRFAHLSRPGAREAA